MSSLAQRGQLQENRVWNLISLARSNSQNNSMGNDTQDWNQYARSRNGTLSLDSEICYPYRKRRWVWVKWPKWPILFERGFPLNQCLILQRLMFVACFVIVYVYNPREHWLEFIWWSPDVRSSDWLNDLLPVIIVIEYVVRTICPIRTW